jgi:putative chitinase
MIDLPRLIACGIGPSTARAFEAPLVKACVRFGIATVAQQAGFLAQAMHESASFTHLEESLWYSSPQNIGRAFRRLRLLDLNELTLLTKNPKGLALAAYSGINGNGGPETGDGWTYRGGGPFQLTGRTNYTRCGAELGLNLVEHPEIIREAGDAAALSAAWFWIDSGCNTLIANADFDGCTRRINGPAMLGAAERRALFSQCLEALR